MEFVEKIRKSNDIDNLNRDFNELDENTKFGPLSFKRVRGSVKLLMGRIFTPKQQFNLSRKARSIKF